jgi:hypothetical protein
MKGTVALEGYARLQLNNYRIGSIERVMIDKISSKVAYAILDFDCGYVTGATENQLRGVPKYTSESRTGQFLRQPARSTTITAATP